MQLSVVTGLECVAVSSQRSLDRTACSRPRRLSSPAAHFTPLCRLSDSLLRCGVRRRSIQAAMTRIFAMPLACAVWFCLRCRRQRRRPARERCNDRCATYFFFFDSRRSVFHAHGRVSLRNRLLTQVFNANGLSRDRRSRIRPDSFIRTAQYRGCTRTHSQFKVYSHFDL